jgi:hypothetical protein
MKKKMIIVLISLVLVGSSVAFWLIKNQSSEKETEGLFEFNQYRKGISFELGNDKALSDFHVGLRIDTLSLIREGKLDFNCSNLRFTDSDKTTEIDHWIKKGCSENNTEIWVRVAEIIPNERKTIYMYYGKEEKDNISNAENVFSGTGKNLVAWYNLNNLFEESDYTDLLNFNNGLGGASISPSDNYDRYGYWPQESEYKYRENEYSNYLFNNWRFQSFLRVPSDNLNFNKKKGTIEMWVYPSKSLNLADECWTDCLNRYQRLFMDSEWEMELGIDPNFNLYFYPAQATSQNYVLIENPLEFSEWNHIVVTWDFDKKEAVFYINGEEKKKSVDNLSKEWKRTAGNNDWYFGGTDIKNIDSYFVGYINNVRVYNEPLGMSDVKDAFKYNNNDARYPNLTFHEEEVLKEKEVPEMDILTLEKLDKFNETKVYVKYASVSDSPGGGYYGRPNNERSERDYIGTTTYLDPNTGERMFRIEKNKNFEFPVFGGPGHINSYQGSAIDAKDDFLVSHLAFEINDPELIKNLKVEFLRYQTYEFGEKEKNKLTSVFPLVHACGWYGGLELFGASNLSLIGEKSGVYWYQLEKPVFINKDTSMIQAYYTPAGKKGKLHLEFLEMVIKDAKNIYFRANVLSPKQISLLEDEGDYYLYKWDGLFGSGWGEDEEIAEKYLAYFAEEELGFVDFKEDVSSQSLMVSFENRGLSSIDIDEQVINDIKNNLIRGEVQSINVQDRKGSIISRISMEEIRKKLLGKKISPGESLKIPFLALSSLSANNSYYITIETDSNKNQEYFIKNNEVISRWILGSNPYYYPRNYQGNKLLTYRLNVKEDKSVSIQEL